MARVKGVVDILWSYHLSTGRVRVQCGPRRPTRCRRRKTQGFIDARFKVIHLAEMDCCDWFSPWVEPIHFCSESFERLRIPEEVEEQRRDDCSSCVGS